LSFRGSDSTEWHRCSTYRDAMHRAALIRSICLSEWSIGQLSPWPGELRRHLNSAGLADCELRSWDVLHCTSASSRANWGLINPSGEIGHTRRCIFTVLVDGFLDCIVCDCIELPFVCITNGNTIKCSIDINFLNNLWFFMSLFQISK